MYIQTVTHDDVLTATQEFISNGGVIAKVHYWRNENHETVGVDNPYEAIENLILENME